MAATEGNVRVEDHHVPMAEIQIIFGEFLDAQNKLDVITSGVTGFQKVITGSSRDLAIFSHGPTKPCPSCETGVMYGVAHSDTETILMCSNPECLGTAIKPRANFSFVPKKKRARK